MSDSDRKDGRSRSAVSRRDFLKGTTVGALTAGLVPGGLLEAAEQETSPATSFVGPGPVPMTLTVNGKPRKLRLEPRVTLLDALRNELDVTGPKRVCDRGTCGACTVLLDGRPVYACSVLAIEARGRTIETVEALGTPDSLHPVQAAFVENDALQCGFCTPGFVVAAKALLDANPLPDDAAIDRALGGNFCRCGTYAGIRRAVHRAARAGKGGPTRG